MGHRRDRLSGWPSVSYETVFQGDFSNRHPNFISSTFIISLKRSNMFNPIELEATITPVLLPISIFLCNESEPKVLQIASRTVLLCCKYICRRRDSGSERQKQKDEASISLAKTGSSTLVQNRKLKALLHNWVGRYGFVSISRIQSIEPTFKNYHPHLQKIAILLFIRHFGL